jgi:AraC-like DNA-binding protein
MKIHIKYMVSLRCKILVKSELDNLGIDYSTINLGEVITKHPVSEDKMGLLKKTLAKSGLELMDDQVALLIERVKTIIIEMIHYSDEYIKVNFSEFISKKLNYNYNQLSNLFSEITGTTIENYIIANKIERVKELLLYDELNLSEIAWKLHYSSVAHLSNQFKKVTGLTPTYFKQLKNYKKRIAIESL